MNAGLIPRMIVGSILLLVIVGAVFAVLIVAMGEQRSVQHPASRSAQTLATEEEVEELLLDMDRTERGFVATRDPALLATWTQQRVQLGERCARLERLAATPAQAEQARRITLHSRSYTDQHAVAVLEAAKRGDPSAGSIETLREDERRVAELRADLDALAAAEERRAADQAADARTATQQALGTVVTGLAAATLVGGCMIAYLHRVVVRPVREAAVMADQVAHGRLDGRVPDAGAGEVGRLNRALNAMTGSIRHNVEDLVRYGRTQAALRRIATHVARGAATPEVLDTVATELGRLSGTDAAHIARFEDDGTATVVAAWGTPGIGLPVGTTLSLDGDSVSAAVYRTGRPARMDSYADARGSLAEHLQQQHVHSAIGAPIMIDSRVWGVVTATVTTERSPARAAESRLAEYAELIATTIANAQARADLAASRARVVVAADQARRRIERDLHDGMQQQLIAIAIDVADGEASVPPDLPELRGRLSRVTHRLTGALDDLREISRGIHPAILTDCGLRSALKPLARRSAIPVELDVRLESRLPEPVEVAAYYIVAESLTNAARHARATYVRVEAATDGDHLYLTVRDDGVGGADPAAGTGLIGLADRVQALGGTLDLTSPPGEGTTLRVRLPLAQP
ncbi:GAF domain-containing protein [Dactylosporangium sp. AC04546]|uniref:sensor histidine kinase n=1 Tax=Dactylosporangium sp. AC04546 TaxID=2862460 RepID=UPI001EE06ED0|nr:HAMP domain-containing protein [Dactylosporangium sp. AC04546]WVK88396.1 GAF domain-containing protein [Dactylosporangium sp. AC04546]